MATQIDGFMQDAGSKLMDAERLTKISRHAEAVQRAQEAIELYAKSVFLLVGQAYPRRHEFTEEEFLAVIDEVPAELKYLRFPRLYLLHRFWAAFYTTSKYGYEALETPPSAVFGSDEAKLAIIHGREWQNAAIRLRTVVTAPAAST